LNVEGRETGESIPSASKVEMRIDGDEVHPEAVAVEPFSS
jgi:hypothetical protein